MAGACGWFGSCGHLRWRRRNCWTRRWLGNNRAWRMRNLCWLRRWNDRWLWNNWRRCWRCVFCFDGARRRSGMAARLGNTWSGGRRNHRSRGRRSYHGRLHASRSGGCFFRRLVRYGPLLGHCLCVGNCAKVLAHFYCGFYLNRAGMRFFLGNAGFGQIVDDGFCLDLEFASQFVDSDLVRIGHCPPGRLLFSVLV